MTEIIRNIEVKPLLFKPQKPVNVIDAKAFFIALIGAPILVAALGFWALLIPVFALVLGGPAYLVFGTPVLLWALSFHRPNPLQLMLLGFCVHLISVPFASLFIQDTEYLFTVHIGFGAVFAPLWAFTFGKLYDRLSKTNQA